VVDRIVNASPYQKRCNSKNLESISHIESGRKRRDSEKESYVIAVEETPGSSGQNTAVVFGVTNLGYWKRSVIGKD